ncbi:hypothetical protein AB0N65_06875 [Paenarthrobacter sp. NPDC089322]|uniref:IS1096 element passenger TnpR family protein n=1 Tax=Paenarthrobacter sp. NPDC089322 TaxID=3155065 RepID=UPI003438C7E5
MQCAFGWKDCHLYDLTGQDRTGKKRIITLLDGDAPEDAEAARDVRLLALFDPSSRGKSELEYEYDFGDRWTHEIDVVGPAVLPDNTFACTGGAMRGPH